MNENQTIECGEHGKANATYVCRHLINGDNTHWYSAEPNAEDSWPDAWCGICNQFFEDEGEWNAVSEQAAELTGNIKLLCHQCYEHIRMQCTTHFI